LWSALVFPGSGQIALKHTRRGLFFAVIASICLIFMIVVVVRETWNGLEEQALRGYTIGFSELIDSGFAALNTVRKYILPPLLLCWFSSVVDAWRLGRDKG
jgi:hypothetical protein